MPRIAHAAPALIGAVIVVVIQPVVSVPAAAATEPTLVLDPTEAGVSGQVTATGTCDPGDEFSQGSAAFDGAGVASSSVDPSTGEFGPVSFTVPAGAEPGSHQVTTDCGGSAPFVVDQPTSSVQPTLVLDPAEAGVSGQVTATGTCDPGDEFSQVRSEERSWRERGSLVGPGTGVFGTGSFPGPAGAGP